MVNCKDDGLNDVSAVVENVLPAVRLVFKFGRDNPSSTDAGVFYCIPKLCLLDVRLGSILLQGTFHCTSLSPSDMITTIFAAPLLGIEAGQVESDLTFPFRADCELVMERVMW